MNTLQHDAELVGQVKFLCDRAKKGAQKLAARFDDPRFETEKQQYLQTKFVAMKTTNRIRDRFYFETAINAPITLCVAANDMQDAQRLFSAITIDDIREAVLRAHPQLGIGPEG